MTRIDTIQHIDAALAALGEADPRLRPVIAAAGRVPLRRIAPGFDSMVSIVISQQVSRASAEAITGRLRGLVDPLTPDAMLASEDALFRQAGVSRPKERTLRALAHAVRHDGLDLYDLCERDPAEAIAELVRVPGIGPWTAEIYLLFAAGHPDILPAKDLALQAAAAHAFGLPQRPDARALSELGESWAPWRGVAARLLWAYYAAFSGRDALPAPPEADS